MNNKLKTIESYLPIFTGFYNTEFSCECEDEEIEDGKTYDDYEWDYKEYNNRVAMATTELVAEQLKELGITTKYQKLISPRYYNYSNDSINVEYTLSDDTMKLLLQFILENFEDFNDYVKSNYTSYDGFMSFYSSNGIDWLTNYILEGEKLDHVFGALLEFYLDVNEYGIEDVIESLYAQGELYHIERKLIEVTE